MSLYFVTNSDNLKEEDFLTILEKACLGGVSIVQLREKEKSTKDFLNLAFKVKQITDKFNIPLIINDRIDVAIAVNASGVHLGENDMNLSIARNLLGSEKIIGTTCKTLKSALECEKNGSDYLGVGAIYETTTKVETKITTINTLKEITSHVKIPVYAIGGLNIDNIEILKNTNISGVCAVSSIIKSKNPEKYCNEFLEKINHLMLKNNLNKVLL